MSFGMKRHGLLAGMVAVVASTAMLAGVTVTANAKQAGNNLPGYTFNAASSGTWHNEGGAGLGPIARNSDGTWEYCTQAGVDSGSDNPDGWQEATTDVEKTAAWLAHDAQNDESDMTQAAVSYAIHEHLDPMSAHAANSHFNDLVNAGLKDADINAVKAKAAELWAKAAAKTASSAKTEVKYTQGQRRGTVTAAIVTASGGYLAGVPYRVKYDSAMVSVDRASGVTDGKPITINWTALKTGSTKMHVEYDAVAARKLIPSDANIQTRFKPATRDPKSKSSPEVSFKVTRGMKLTLTSDATRAYTDGLNVNDVVKTEKGDRLADTIRVNATDLGNDHKDIDKDGLNHDTDDWVMDTGNKRVPITVKADIYGPYTDQQADQYRKTGADGKQAVPADAKKIGEATVTVTDSGDYTVSTKDKSITLQNGLTEATLPLGHYTFVWRAHNDEQANIKQLTGSDVQNESKAGAADGFPLLSNTDEGFFAAREEVETHNMQPTVASSLTNANKDAKETVTGNDGKQRPSIQTASDGITYREKDAPIRDTVTVNVKDSNGDGKIDTYDWLHTAAARESGDYREDTQAPITVEGEMVGTVDKDAYDKYVAAAKKNPLTTLPEGMSVLATTTFDVTRAGDYLVSDEQGDNPTATWKAEEGVDLRNLPSGYVTFRYRIVNADQKNLSKATGVAIAKDYPFNEDADDGYFSEDETMFTRISFDLDSQASFNRVKLGETTGDKLVIRKTNEKDLWPTYDRKAVVEGETGSRDKVKLNFHGYLYKVSDDPEAEVKTLDAKPADLKPVHEARIDGVTDWGSYETSAYTYREAGTYAWYWELEPDLTTADHLTDEAWRKVSHKLVNHVFGLTSEIVRVGEKETACKVSTKAQGKVTAVDGKADLHDTAYLACEKAATIEFELWKQGDGDTGTDVLITTTAKQDATGKTEITGSTVTRQVKDGDRFYWREITRDQQGNVLSYGKARASEETVTVESKEKPTTPSLAKTGTRAALPAMLTVIAMLGGCAAWFGLKRRNRA